MKNNTKIIKWAEEYLLSNGYTINNSPEQIQTTPWSKVIRFTTSRGYIYLKHTPPALSLEPAITKILYDQFQASVPVVIDTNRELHCFLMKDCGNPLREYLKKNFKPSLLGQAIKQYTAIQYAVIENINIFLELGVPDWRLDTLPLLYKKMICHDELLKEDGMTTQELDLLHELYPNFLSMCEKLSNYKIPETLDHCDFHDNNILIEYDSNHMTIIDLGETVITHPFFSLITCLRNAVFRYNLKETDEVYFLLQDACFETWRKFEIINNLSEIFSLATKLWPIYATLGEYRLMASSNAEQFKFLNRRGRLAMGLKEFITNISE
jgi:hypothetical protein